MYNSQASIEKALLSVLKQTYTGEVEIIVVNDGSDDDSRYLVEKVIFDNPEANITLLNQLNAGVSRARNAGIEKAKGEYIAFLDSDDEWLPFKLDKQLDILKGDETIGFLGANPSRGFFLKDNKLRKISAKSLLQRMVFGTSTVIFKKCILDDVGRFDENRKYSEDQELYVRIASKYLCVLLVENLIISGNGKSFFGESGLSSNLIEMEKGELENIRLAYRNNVITKFQWFFISLFSMMKFIKRVIVINVNKLLFWGLEKNRGSKIFCSE